MSNATAVKMGTTGSIDRLVKLLTERERVLLVGRPGCAKTARILTTAKLCGYRVVVFRASLCERVDFGGVMVPDTKAGITRALPLELLHDLMTTKDQVLLFVDDLGQAPMDVQAALMRLFDDGTLPANVVIWGATNRPGDKAGVSALCEPLRSRFTLAFRIPGPGDADDPAGGVPLSTYADEVEGWCDWALAEANAPAEAIAWHRATKGRTLYQWAPHADPSVRMADYRSWATVIRLWNAGMRDLTSLGAAIGRPVAAEFLAFAKLAESLPTPEQVWLDPKGAPVPTEPQALYLVTTFLGVAAEAKYGRQLVTYMERLPRVFGALLARDAHRRIGAKLGGVPEWVRWFRSNEDLFAFGGAA